MGPENYTFKSLNLHGTIFFDMKNKSRVAAFSFRYVFRKQCSGFGRKAVSRNGLGGD